jgi:hypothetical protein
MESYTESLAYALDSFMTLLEAPQTSQTIFFKLFLKSLNTSMNQTNGKNKFLNILKTLINENSEALAAIGPAKRPYLTETAKNGIYEMFGYDSKEAAEAVMKEFITSLHLSGNFITVKQNPCFVFLIVALVYATKHKFSDVEIDIITMGLGLFLYPSVYYKYWKYPPNPSVMEYTINHLPNNYILRKQGKVGNMMRYGVMRSYEFWKAKLDKEEDMQIIYFLNRIKTTVNSYFKNLFRHYKANNDAGLSSTTSEMQDELQIDQTQNINKTIADTIMYLIQNGPDAALYTAVAKAVDISPATLRSLYDETIQQRSLFRTYISTIINDFFTKYPSGSIKTNEFKTYAMNLYKQTASNTYKNLQNISKALDLKNRYSVNRTIQLYLQGIHKLSIYEIISIATK